MFYLLTMSKFHKIAVYQYTTEALLFKGKLESEGIEVFLQDENTINTDPLLSNAIGGVKLLVRKEDVMFAKQILNSIPDYSVDEHGDLLKCPKCGEQKIDYLTSVTDFKSLISFIFGLLLNIFPFYTKYKYRCENCNFEF